MVKIREDEMVNSIIGEGSEFRGEFYVNGLLRIDGKFEGTIHTTGKILVGRTGKVKSDIKAGSVIIGGTVIGNVEATEKIVLLSTARLIGDVITPSLVIEEGVIFEGKCIITKEGKSPKELIQEEGFSFEVLPGGETKRPTGRGARRQEKKQEISEE